MGKTVIKKKRIIKIGNVELINPDLAKSEREFLKQTFKPGRIKKVEVKAFRR